MRRERENLEGNAKERERELQRELESVKGRLQEKGKECEALMG